MIATQRHSYTRQCKNNTDVEEPESESKMPGPSMNEGNLKHERPRPRLQRILRSQPTVRDGVTPSPSLGHPRGQGTSEKVCADPVQASAPQDIQYQCTSCDMMVSPSDSYCPFCGAIFSDDPTGASEEEEDAVGSPLAEERPEPVSPPVRRPERFDVLSMLRSRPRSRDLLYAEALKGFVGSARLLEDIELMISEVSSLGNDTTRARRMMSDAWEACREGDWPLVSALARQTEALVTPNIPDLVRQELAKARNMILQAKGEGMDTSRYLVTAKSAMHALHGNNLDEALRLTKELMDTLREDSAQWSRGRR